MKFSRQVLCGCLLYCFVATARSTRQENVCYTPDNSIGVCVLLPYCPSVLQLYAANGGKRQLSDQVAKYLKGLRLNCGLRVLRDVPVVCCVDAYNGLKRPEYYEQQPTNNPFLAIVYPHNISPEFFTIPTPENCTVDDNTPPPITLNTSTSPPPPATDDTSTDEIDQRANGCQGPDARSGTCQSLVDCPELANRLKSNPSDQSFAQFLRQSNEACRQRVPFVCCPAKSNDPVIKINIPKTVPSVRPSSSAGEVLLTPEEGCGQTGVTHKKIVGGTPSKLGSWPWIALIGYIDSLGNTGYRCGGSLITKRHVVTAAHCITNTLQSVRLGEHNLATETETAHVNVNVARAARHPSYDKRDGHSDIAILYLERDIKFSDTIRPICIPKESDYATRSLIGYNPFVAGWGRTIEGGNSSQILQEVQLPILSNNECKKRYQVQQRLVSQKQFNEAIMCAGELTGGKDTCQGDSGGPLMLPEKLPNTTNFYYNLIGIVSYGVGCARAGIPGVYARVPTFSDWIRQKVAEPIKV